MIVNDRRIPFESPLLGRHVLHDDRSRGFPAPRAVERRNVVHKWLGPLYNQYLGTCTINTLFNVRNSAPNHKPYTRYLPESQVVPLYSEVTRRDPFAGAWPPDDTGSNELTACKVALEKGLITRYTWGFGLDHCLDSLVERPGGFGTNWYRSMFEPDDQGFVDIRPNSPIDGGHEWTGIGVDFDQEFIWAVNSWGAWGIGHAPTRRKYGYFKVRFSTLDRLLREDGDFVVPIREW